MNRVTFARIATAVCRNDVDLLWAKLGAGAFAERHPLLYHMLDAGMVAQQIWQRVLTNHTRARWAASLNVDCSSACCFISVWAALHDIGKASPGFQSQSAEAEASLRNAGFSFTRKDRCPHGTLSSAILADILTSLSQDQPSLTSVLARRVAIAVGGHHGLFPMSAQWGEVSKNELGYGQKWHAARCELFSRVSVAFGLRNCRVPCESIGQNAHWPMMLLAGLTSVADWIASNVECFPHTASVADVAEYATLSRERAEKALDVLGWTGWHRRTDSPRQFNALFPSCSQPRPLQTAVIDAACEIAGASLTLIEAPTGEGKTEAALYLADQWNHAHSGQGLYVAMPTMATGNEMFRRVTEFLRSRYPENRIDVHLVHGLAILSDDYQALRFEAIREVYDDETPGRLVAEEWFAKSKKRAMLAPFGIGTIDQMLMSVLQVKHVFVRLFGAAGKMVIFDEVHAYDTYMSSLLDRLLEWLQTLGCSVILLSATLPSVRKQQLLQAWMGKEPTYEQRPYPSLVTVQGCDVITKHFAANAESHRTIGVSWCEADRLADELAKALQHGGCVAIIRNTVKEAQETYRNLKARLAFKHPSEIDSHDVTTPQIDLFHARYVFEDRDAIEHRVVARYGKGVGGRIDNDNRPFKSVLIATQVVEQSLDLDFDLLISDFAPIDLLIQRMGRLHRHPRRGRSIAKPMLWMLKPEQFETVPEFGNSEYVYERYILLRSFLAFRNRQRIVLPDDVQTLIEGTYGKDTQIGGQEDAWRRALDLSNERLEGSCRADMQRARGAIIDPPNSVDDPISSFNRQLEEDNPDAGVSMAAATRMTRPAVQLVLWPESYESPHTGVRPNGGVVKRILKRSLAIQDARLVKRLQRQSVPEGWRDSSLFRFHRLVRLDGDGRCLVGECEIQYSSQLGMVIEAEN